MEPTGTSLGEAAVLATRSHNTINVPPNNALAGRIFLWDEPKNRLTTWGAIKSTNPMIPAKATAVPVSTATPPIRSHLLRLKFTPMACACSSPKVIISISREHPRKNNRHKASTGSRIHMLLHSLAEKLPNCHRLILWA